MKPRRGEICKAKYVVCRGHLGTPCWRVSFFEHRCVAGSHWIWWTYNHHPCLTVYRGHDVLGQQQPAGSVPHAPHQCLWTLGERLEVLGTYTKTLASLGIESSRSASIFELGQSASASIFSIFQTFSWQQHDELSSHILLLYFEIFSFSLYHLCQWGDWARGLRTSHILR